MYYDSKPELQLVADNTTSLPPAIETFELYAQEIYQRRRRLYEDLAYFESKLIDLEQLDPYDFTGLGNIYREHARHIQGLVDTIDENID